MFAQLILTIVAILVVFCLIWFPLKWWILPLLPLAKNGKKKLLDVDEATQRRKELHDRRVVLQQKKSTLNSLTESSQIEEELSKINNEIEELEKKMGVSK